jgi:hypothetical protein
VKDLYNGNYKTLKKETGKDQKMERPPIFMDWQNHCSGNSYTTKSIYRIYAIPIKILMSFFTDIEKSMLKFIWHM